MSNENLKDLNNKEELAKTFYNLYINSSYKLENIKDFAKMYQISPKIFIDVVVYYIENHINQPEYVKIFNQLLLLRTKESIIEFLNKSTYNINYLRNNLLSYFIFYRPDIYFYLKEDRKNLEEKLGIYTLYLKEKEIVKMPLINKNSIEYIESVFNDFLNSNYTLDRFCYNRRILKESFKTYLNKIKKENRTLYNQVLLKINISEEYKNKIIESEVYKILNMVEEKGKEFSFLDFLENTVCSVNEIIKAADKLLNPVQNKTLRQVISNFKLSNKVLIGEDIKLLLKEKFVFNVDGDLIEVTDEDKEKIINYLENKNIPVCISTFKSAYFRVNQNKFVKKI